MKKTKNHITLSGIVLIVIVASFCLPHFVKFKNNVASNIQGNTEIAHEFENLSTAMQTGNIFETSVASEQTETSAVSEQTEESLLNLEYTGQPAVAVNNNMPYFDDLSDTSFETYAELDGLGRTGTAFACIGRDLMPEGDRDFSLTVNPSGWKQAKYEEIIDNGGWLYNRCHLIGWQLTGEEDNPENLMTGTRYFNIDGMLDIENEVADYLTDYDVHVMYRVTPVYSGDDLLARGVLIEYMSVEDNGQLHGCYYVFNVQPGIKIDYSTGESERCE